MRARYLTCAALSALVLAPAAAAHITASPAEIPVGFGYTQFSVPHGCDGSSTTKITIRIPEGIASVKPEVVAGWEIETTTGPLAQPVSVHGEEITEGVTEMSWTGGPLPDSQLQRFGVSFFASESLADQTSYWPIVQECEDGMTRWIEIPVEGEEEPPEPAAGIAFLASGGDEHGGATDEAMAEDEAAAEATDEAAAENTETVEAVAASSSDDDSSSRANAALVLGGIGLVAGLAALGVAIFRTPRPKS